MRKITKFRRSVKAISPIISVLLMIAIAVSAALVAFAWVSGYMDFTTTKVGKSIQIQSVSPNAVYVQNVGDSPVSIADVYVDGNLVAETTDYSIDDAELDPSETASIVFTSDLPTPQATIKVVTTDGISAQYTETFSGATAGTGGSTPYVPPTVTRVLSTEAGFSGVQAGDLLVVIANQRTGSWTTGSLTATATGYTQAGIGDYYGSSSYRRAVVLLYKIADGTESGSVSVSWSGSGISTYETLYQVFRGASTWTVKDNGATTGSSSSSTTMTVPGTALSGGTVANVLSIGAMVWRDNPGTPSFTNLGTPVEFDYNDCYSATASNYGLPVTQTTVTWPTARLASGLLVQFSCD